MSGATVFVSTDVYNNIEEIRWGVEKAVIALYSERRREMLIPKPELYWELC